MPKRIGDYTIELTNKPHICGYAAVVGKKEGEGPLSKYFDRIEEDTTLGQDSWEKAESLLQKNALEIAIKKAKFTKEDIQLVFAGDLLNQCTGSTFGLRSFNIPFAGLYGACSTMALSLSMASLIVDSSAADRAAAITSSHFCSAERQFRLPVDYGGQRTPTAQWTVTGSGAAIVSSQKGSPYVDKITLGRMVDLGITDANNMGAAMAPAAADTISRYFKDTATSPKDYDLIVTGDLGEVGSTLLADLLSRDGIDIKGKHTDCGLLMFDRESQDVHAGGSGCGCAASVLCSFLLKRLQEGELRDILFCATGAMMSPTSSLQGESIPGVAHLIHIVGKEN